MPTVINFIHGWGFCGDFWEPIATKVAHQFGTESVCFDLGFYGNSPNGGSVMNPPLTSPLGNNVVCHSYGLMWFLLRNPNFGGQIIAFNGVPCFKSEIKASPSA